jgi:predicted DNA-binding ribbon-helix-helix protein
MTSGRTKRSIAIEGQKTSVSLENEFWRGVKEIAGQRDMTLSDLIKEIGAGRPGNLSSALRVYVLEHYQAEAVRHRSLIGTASALGT